MYMVRFTRVTLKTYYGRASLLLVRLFRILRDSSSAVFSGRTVIKHIEIIKATTYAPNIRHNPC